MAKEEEAEEIRKAKRAIAITDNYLYLFALKTTGGVPAAFKEASTEKAYMAGFRAGYEYAKKARQEMDDEDEAVRRR